MSRLRNLTVSIQTRTGNAVSQLQRLNGRVDRLKHAFQRLTVAAERFGRWGLLRITMPLVGLGGLMVNTASWAEEMGTKFDTVFGDMADASRQWADDTAEAIGRSSLQLQDYLAETQNMLVGMGQARDEAALFSQEIVQMGIDLASFNNMAEDQAINNLQSALTGIHTASRSLGAVLNENTLELAMQEMGLRGTFQELDENRKMQVRYRAILMQSDDAMGDAERTSGSFANQVRALRGEMKDLSAELGQELLPFVTNLVGRIREGVNWFGELESDTRRAILAIGGVTALSPPLALLFAGISKVAKIIGVILLPIAIALKMPILAVVAVILLAILVFQDFYTHLKGGEAALSDLWEVLIWFAESAWGSLQTWWGHLQDLWDWWTGLPDKMDNLLIAIDDTIAGWVESALGWVDRVVEGFLNIPDRVMAGLSGFGDRLKEGFEGALQGARNLLPFSPVKDRTSPLADLHKAGANIVENIREGMQKSAAMGFNQTVAATAAPVTSGGNYSFNPNINIEVNGGTEQTAQDIKTEMGQMFPRLMNQFFREASRKR